MRRRIDWTWTLALAAAAIGCRGGEAAPDAGEGGAAAPAPAANEPGAGAEAHGAAGARVEVVVTADVSGRRGAPARDDERRTGRSDAPRAASPARAGGSGAAEAPPGGDGAAHARGAPRAEAGQAGADGDPARRRDPAAEGAGSAGGGAAQAGAGRPGVAGDGVPGAGDGAGRRGADAGLAARPAGDDQGGGPGRRGAGRGGPAGARQADGGGDGAGQGPAVAGEGSAGVGAGQGPAGAGAGRGPAGAPAGGRAGAGAGQGDQGGPAAAGATRAGGPGAPGAGAKGAAHGASGPVGPDAPLDGAVAGADLLTIAAGASVVRESSAYNDASHAVELLDDALETQWRANTDQVEAQEAVFELAARARVTHVTIGVDEGADWAQGQRVRVELGPTADGPWTVLHEAALEAGAPARQALEAPPEGRYVRVELPARADPEAPAVAVGQVSIHGTFVEPVALADFTGAWNAGWLLGPLALRQDGVRLRGRFEDGRPIVGTVDGRAALLRFRNREGVEVAALFVRTAAAEHPFQLLVKATPEDEPTQALGTFTAVEGEPPAWPEEARDPLEEALERDGAAVVHDLPFEPGKARLPAAAAPLLDRLAALLAARADWRLVIECHVDDAGGEDYARRLTARRAEVLVEALVARGVAQARLEAAGLGAARPLAGGATAPGRALDRRIVLVRRTD